MGCVSCTGAVLDGNVLTLVRREASPEAVDGSGISPDRFLGKSAAEIARLPARLGGREVTLGDLFAIEGFHPEQIVVRGDVRSLTDLGRGMTRGEITVLGDVGPRVGAEMRGGEIVVQGAAGDALGARMRGGRILVEGGAGDFCGTAVGEPGQTGGTIVVRGPLGEEAGARMRGGMLVALGSTGERTGADMEAGTIFVAGRTGPEPGLGMHGGTIVVFGDAEPPATFDYACTYQPVFPGDYLRELRRWGLAEEDGGVEGAFRRYLGDLDSVGKGEILVRDQS